MNARINGEVNFRYTATFLFDENAFYDFCINNKVSLEDLEFLLDGIVNFCKSAHLPYKNKMSLFRQLEKLKEIKDKFQKKRIEIIDEAKDRIDEAKSIDSYVYYRESVLKKNNKLFWLDELIPRFRYEQFGHFLDENRIIKDFMDTVHDELEIFSTHFIKDYFKDNPTEAFKYAQDYEYFGLINFLIHECKELLDNEAFVNNVKDVFKYVSEFETLWENRKLSKVLIKKG